MSRRFPALEYRNELRRETEVPDPYAIRWIGTPEPDIECVYVRRENEDNEILGTVFFLQMNADERYVASNTESETRPNYEFYFNENDDPFFTCSRFDVAKKKWFELLDEHVH